MCLSLRAKGEIDTEDVLPPVQIRKRYNPARRETTLEFVRPTRERKISATFWLCMCGSRMHIDIMHCHGCGRHRHHKDVVSEEVKKVEKAYESLKKELSLVEKDLKDIKAGCDKKADEKKGDDKNDKSKPACNCGEKKEADEKKDQSCKCGEKGKTEKKSCNCLKPPTTAKPSPCPPQLPFIPYYPAPCLGPPPTKPNPPPEVQPERPGPEPPIVNVIVPECRDNRQRNSRHRRRSHSNSSSSTISNRSFERVKNKVSGLGRRVWGLETREQFRDRDEMMRRADENHRRAVEYEQRDLQRERSARQRARERELEYCEERGRRRLWHERGNNIEVDPIRVLPFPYQVVPQPRRYMDGRRGGSWSYIEHREGERVVG